ncbi:MAG: hypothetical protein DRO99_02735 [Candidatus Aenigmatarchaeota archaeon]|nr:MAG: hypothetical protein DRO99_02735 [Candidatus Aenigmarchaeota archaeon]
MDSFYGLMTLLITAFVIPVVSLKTEKLAPYIAVASSFVAFILSTTTAFTVFREGIQVQQMEGWPAPFGITLAVDHLSIIPILLVSAVGFLVILFSFRFISRRKTEYYSITLLLLGSLMGVLHTGDMFNLFVFLEISAITSYILVAFKKEKESIEASIKYLIINSISTSMILLGIALLYGALGTLNMADLALEMSAISDTFMPISMGLILSGLAIKSGFVPFHTWLPDAHPAAPSPISAILSGLVISVGMYAIIRVSSTVYSSYAVVFNMLIVLGVISMTVGALMALMQHDLKRMLAYSSISQMGYIGMAVGMATPLGLAGGIFHLINQAIIKSLLFLCSGVIIHKAGTHDMRKMGAKFSSFTAGVFLIGVLSLAGLPFFNGFSSKLLIYIASFNAFPLLTVIAVVTSAITAAYGIKAFVLIFMRNTGKSSITGMPLTMQIPLAILAMLCILLGIIPGIGESLAGFAVSNLNNMPYIRAVLGG